MVSESKITPCKDPLTAVECTAHCSYHDLSGKDPTQCEQDWPAFIVDSVNPNNMNGCRDYETS